LEQENLYLMSFISLSPQVVAVISKAYAVTSQTVMTVTQGSVPDDCWFVIDQRLPEIDQLCPVIGILDRKE